MPDIFSDLSSMGLSNLSGIKIFDEEEKKQATKGEEKSAAPKISETDFLFDKSVKCPVCDREFKVKTVKTGKPRLIGSDMDLRPKYQGIDPVKYDVIACPKCGYAALSRFFNYMTPAIAKMITENISNSFKGLPQEGPMISYDEAIARYKLALLNTVIKKSKTSERAYTCLKLGWLYRGKAENLNQSAPDYNEQKAECNAVEAEFINNAYEGFSMAITKELYPICGMDEVTVDYLLANLAFQTNRRDESLRFLSKIITSNFANAKIKDKARDLRDIIVSENKKS